jgi:sugar phosphate isomerase/epimerase
MEIAGEAKFDAVELELYDEMIADHRRDLGKMKAILQKYSMTCPSVMAVEEKMFSLDQSVKEKALRDFDALTDMIVELRSSLVSICGYMPPEIRPQGTELYRGGPQTAVVVAEDFSWSAFWANAVDVVRKMAEIARRKRLTLIVETRANDVFSSTDAIMNLLKESGAANVGVLLDVAHVHAGKEYLALVIRKLGSMIKLVHLSDNDASQAYHYAPGRGNIDFAAVIRDLKRIGYNGYVVVDISGVPNILDEAVKARSYYQSLIDLA